MKVLPSMKDGTPIEATADGSATLYSARHRQTFHSRRGALAEARHVFLEGSGVAGRLARGVPTHVCEVGFGAGLNFLVTADLALRTGTRLEYTALELELLPAATLRALAYGRLLAAPGLAEALLTARAGLPDHPEPGRYALELAENVRLELRLGDATRQDLGEAKYDAVYQDAFSPDANPELWSEAFFETLRKALRPGGRLVSYCVKGEVRRRLTALGFEVTRRPGPPGGKREMLLAVKSSQAAP